MDDKQFALMMDAIKDLRTRLEAIESLEARAENIDARLSAIEQCMRDQDTLAERREKHRLAVARSRRKLRDVTSHENVTSQKEKGKGKETFPPAPPIEKRESQEKKEEEVEDARARAGEKIRKSRIAEVAKYNEEIKGNIDPEYFVDYYADNWPRNWQARLRNWLKQDKRAGRISAEERAAAKEKKREAARAAALLKMIKESESAPPTPVDQRDRYEIPPEAVDFDQLFRD